MSIDGLLVCVTFFCAVVALIALMVAWHELKRGGKR